MPQVRLICVAFAALLVGLLVTGCSSPLNEEAVKVHRDRARVLVEKQEFSEALTAY